MKNKQTPFDSAVSSMQTASMRTATKSGKVSAADLSSIKTKFDGRVRSAVVTTAFGRLVSEKRLRRLKTTVNNPYSGREVTVYANIAR